MIKCKNHRTDFGVLYFADNKELMKKWVNDSDIDKFDLLLCDPPYGIHSKNVTGFVAKRDKSAMKWDKAPDKACFDMMLALGKKVVIFGGNYFGDHLGRCIAPIVWDKQTGDNYFADGEYAWTNFKEGTLRIIRHQWCGAFKASERGVKPIHPTQKPVDVLAEIIKQHTKEGDTVFDPFGGSCSTAIACINMNRRYVCIEANKTYYRKAVKRIDEKLDGWMFTKPMTDSDLFDAITK